MVCLLGPASNLLPVCLEVVTLEVNRQPSVRALSIGSCRRVFHLPCWALRDVLVRGHTGSLRSEARSPKDRSPVVMVFARGPVRRAGASVSGALARKVRLRGESHR